ncbi:hypothetical protein HUT18_29525 [Streptomyces sp. NA04227]|uniref:choice-of-anchor P family protein n=1 Tax=Streptomyces sp. NA04227 TaxID=2742136 RepID=UPI0015904C2B|nr:choice-of-anchor P family protein [Streptomyces sp. NA04227]QKW09936.1 hypothetical protein HUT18_29525 [Streptomyces sp. NA04227]
MDASTGVGSAAGPDSAASALPAEGGDKGPPIGNQGQVECDTELGTHAPFYGGQSASQTYDTTFSALGTDPLPDLGTSEAEAWTPQGLAHWSNWDGAGNDLLLVTAYGPEGGEARVHGIDPASGEHVGSVELETKEDDQSHVGGIVVLGKHAYVSAYRSKSVNRYYLPELRRKFEEYRPPIGDVELPRIREKGHPTDIANGVAFLGTDGEALYAGRYVDDDATTRTEMDSYRPDEKGMLSRDDGPTYVAPRRTQGVTVVDGDFYFSVSRTPKPEVDGRRSFLYRVGPEDMKANAIDNQLPPPSFNQATECFRAPSMSEGIVTHGDRTYLLFESGSAVYALEEDNPPENVVKKIHVARLGSGDGDDGDGPGQGSSTTTYTGPTKADYHDTFTASARLSGASGPVSKAKLSFTLGKGRAAQNCTATTDSSGVGTCELTPAQAPGRTSLTVRFGGGSGLGPSSDTTAFTITRQETALTYKGPKRVANGTPARLAGVLTEESAGGRPVAGRSVTLALGRGDDRQACTGTTADDGRARCTIASVDQPLNADATVPVTAAFEGDTYYEPSRKRATVLLEHYTGRSHGITAEVSLAGLGLGVKPSPDTGPVRTAHASRHVPGCAAGVNTLLLRTGTLCPTVVTSLAPGTSRATAAVQDVRIGLPGLPLIEVAGATARSTSTCAAGGSARGTTDVRLRVGGELVELTGEPNAEVDLPGVARLVVNEQRPVPGAEHGRTVNAVHLTAANGAVDVVIASATSDVHNCAE